jgi:hypothetical protein
MKMELQYEDIDLSELKVKICTKCNEVRLFSDYDLNYKYKYGLNLICNKCLKNAKGGKTIRKILLLENKDEQTTKVCIKCEEQKPISYFIRIKKKWNNNVCIQCRRKYYYDRRMKLKNDPDLLSAYTFTEEGMSLVNINFDEIFEKINEIKNFKVCTRCKITKPFSDYTPLIEGKDNLTPSCKECRNKYQAKRRKEKKYIKYMF